MWDRIIRFGSVEVRNKAPATRQNYVGSYILGNNRANLLNFHHDQAKCDNKIQVNTVDYLTYRNTAFPGLI